ncbi:MAG TPA: gluconokinase [Stellaceae bacterium]|nr:gluconokinase [Stellaceae bacterium]
MGEQRGTAPAHVLVLMGVSGSGKTTVGAHLAGRLGWSAAEADDFHPAQNVAKMRSGVPLDDADRLPWLEAIAAQIDRWRSDGKRGVITCSALKRRYRDIIVGKRPEVRLVFLKGERELIADRLAARLGHFMPPTLLESQFAALEEPTAEERPVVVPIHEPPPRLAERIIAALNLRPSRAQRD